MGCCAAKDYDDREKHETGGAAPRKGGSNEQVSRSPPPLVQVPVQAPTPREETKGPAQDISPMVPSHMRSMRQVGEELPMGEKVEGVWSDGVFYPGWIVGVDRGHDRYLVKFEDGEESVLGITSLRRRFCPGDRVDARWKGQEFYRGVIDAALPDGFYSICFDDGGFEPQQPHQYIKIAVIPSALSKGALPPPGSVPHPFPKQAQNPSGSGFSHADRRN
eukprot:TRINITY_DN7116_c4_g1_i1.p1 TRINITY_DN7116_c4_g1~~TRINITY_DN7116_c4_g1_i1.p1  ORF type:complete len:237 (+),score=27.69 TRINITY_DN7116_c4_g1_i1:55-711(+)